MWFQSTSLCALLLLIGSSPIVQGANPSPPGLTFAYHVSVTLGNQTLVPTPSGLESCKLFIPEPYLH